MNLRTTSLAILALLGTAGCVSVPADPPGPAPTASGHSRNTPSAHASAPPAAPSPLHDTLDGPGGHRDDGDHARRRAEEARTEGAPSAGRKTGATPPAAPRKRREARGPAPARPEPRRTGAARGPQPRQMYDMRAVCATGDGIASAEVLDLCRTAYGR
ncbi:hypothetical protein [Streptomyces nitrosporeus]|uniref:hypothetical protein n=1 Tax=Streptomyces nitrosporeus TaxID=28894 RepID=UPI0039A213B1